MSNRTVAILAVAVVISSLCIYATFAQGPSVPGPADGAIVVDPPPIRFQQELPGRFQLERMTDSSVVVIDTHTGRCWSRTGRRWHDWGSPAEQE